MSVLIRITSVTEYFVAFLTRHYVYVCVKNVYCLACINFWTRNWSHITTHLVLVLFVPATVFKKAWGSIVSNQIGMKFGGIVLQVKYASIDGVRFLMGHHTFKMAAMTSFHTEKCCHLVSVQCNICPKHMQQRQSRRGCRGHIPSNILVRGHQWEYPLNIITYFRI